MLFRSHIPTLLEFLEIPYSGSDPLGLAITLDKSLAKRIALSLGIKTPPFWVLDGTANLHDVPGRFPFFVKPLWQGSSRGIRFSSRVNDQNGLKQEINRLFHNYPDEPVIVEEYIQGREFTVTVIGNKTPEVFGIMEMTFQDSNKKDFCYSLEIGRA